MLSAGWKQTEIHFRPKHMFVIQSVWLYRYRSSIICHTFITLCILSIKSSDINGKGFMLSCILQKRAVLWRLLFGTKSNRTKERNITKARNITEVRNITKIRNITKARNITEVRNVTTVKNITKVRNITEVGTSSSFGASRQKIRRISVRTGYNIWCKGALRPHLQLFYIAVHTAPHGLYSCTHCTTWSI